MSETQEPDVDDYAFWQAEIDGAEKQHRDTEAPIAGFWRSTGARTKHDEPYAIYYSPNTHEPIVIKGRLQGRVYSDVEWFRLKAFAFPHFVAVGEKEWHDTVEAGRWPDGKRATRDKDDPDEIDDLDNSGTAPIDEVLRDKIEALASRINETRAPTNQAEADAASALLDRMRALLKIAEAERVKEKSPIDERAKAVQTKWHGVKNPGHIAADRLENDRRAWLIAEQSRLRREAEAAAAAQRAAIAAEVKAQGYDDATAEAAAVAEVKPVEVPRVTSGGAFARKSGLHKVPVATITDGKVLIAHLWKTRDETLLAALQTVADRSARAKITLPGVTVTIEER